MTSNLTVKIGADVDGLRKELNKATSQLNGFNKQMAGIGKMMAGAFTIGAIVGVGKAVFDTTAKFEKFNAVLTNTLGSSAAAKLVMQDITDFAAKTPFQVDELTSSFVKLANQGFLPTMDEMRKLGDLASSQGKSFDQLTEAIIDAQTGEFERLKEFGVRAQKEGDKVSFTFKGVKTQVDFTNESIRNYVLGLGDATGVSGAMEAQSKTLGGGVSNLSDAFDQLAVSIGNNANNGGILNKILDGLAGGVRALNDTFRESNIDEIVKGTKQLKDAKDAAFRRGDLEEWEALRKLVDQGVDGVQKYLEGQRVLEEKRADAVDKSTKKLEKQKKVIEEITDKGQRMRFGLDSLVLPDARLGGRVKGADRDFVSKMPEVNTGPLTKMAVDMESVAARMQTASITATNALYSIPRTAIEIAPILERALTDVAMTLGEGIGNIIAGTGKIADLGPALLGTFGGVLTQLGELAIQTGVAMLGIKAAFESLNPYVAIAAGIALVALGQAVGAKTKKLGGSIGGGGGRGSGAPSEIRRTDNASNTISIQLEGGFKIEGRDLVYAMEKNQKLEGKRKA